MKYTSTINNLKCVEWQLTLSQAFLMELLTFASNWAKRETVDGIDYYWVSRNKVLDEIPNAFKTADTVYRALVALDKKGVIEYKKLGRKDIFRVTEKGKEWIFIQPKDTSKLGKKSELNQNSEKNPSKSGNKSEFNSELNPTDKDTSINKDTSNKDVIPFDDFWDAYDKKIDRAKCLAKWEKLTAQQHQEIMSNVHAYVAANNVKQYRKNPLTYLNGECWLDEIITSQPTKNNQGLQDAKQSKLDELEQYINSYGTEQEIRHVN